MLTYTSVASHLLIKKEDKITKIKKHTQGKLRLDTAWVSCPILKYRGELLIASLT